MLFFGQCQTHLACLICRTNAKFFAILDRQSSSDAKESLVRYHGHVSALVEKHQLGGYDEVYSTIQNSSITQQQYLCTCLQQCRMECSAVCAHALYRVMMLWFTLCSSWMLHSTRHFYYIAAVSRLWRALSEIGEYSAYPQSKQSNTTAGCKGFADLPGQLVQLSYMTFDDNRQNSGCSI